MIGITSDKSRSFEETLPYYAIEEDKIILQDGRIALGYMISPVEMESWEIHHYAEFNQMYAGALKSLPVGSVVQKIDIYYHQSFRTKSQERGYFKGKFKSHFQDRLVLFHKSYLFLSFASNSKFRSNPVNTFFSLGRSVVENPFAKVDSRMAEAERIGEEFVNSLTGTQGLGFNRLDTGALQSVYHQYFNLEFNPCPTGYSRSISNQYSFMGIGEKKVNVISLKGQGNQVYQAVKNHYNVAAPVIDALTHYLNLPHILITNFLIEDTEKELKSLDLEKKLNASLEFLTGQDHQIKELEIDQFTEQVRSRNQQLVNLNLTGLVWHSNDYQREKGVEKVTTAFRQLGGAECVVESFDSTNLFYANAPGNAFQNYRWLLVTAENAVAYNNYTTTYQGDAKGEYLCDRFRNPVIIDLFNTDLNNQNCIVVGPSGSGKSYTMGDLIAQRHEKGNRQVIIDKGGTYKNVFTALKGKYFEYDVDSELQFNPFVVSREKYGKFKLTGEKINFLTSLLATIWKGSIKGVELTPAERSVFVELLPVYYQSLKHGECPGLNHFYQWLIKYHQAKNKDEDHHKTIRSFDFDEFILVLKPYAVGEYRYLLNADSETDISSFDLVCFDIERIKNNQMLFPIVTLLIIEMTMDQIRKYPDDIKYLYLDEAWTMLSETMGEFVENMYRTVRKNNGSICIITQGVSEITNSPVGQAIIDNADTRIILNHTDSEAVAKLGKVFGFTPHEIDKINSIGKGNTYRELFIKQGEYGKVYCMEVSPYEHAVLSSKPKERNYLKALLEYYQGNTNYAINHFVEEKQNSSLRA